MSFNAHLGVLTSTKAAGCVFHRVFITRRHAGRRDAAVNMWPPAEIFRMFISPRQIRRLLLELYEHNVFQVREIPATGAASHQESITAYWIGFLLLDYLLKCLRHRRWPLSSIGLSCAMSLRFFTSPEILEISS